MGDIWRFGEPVFALIIAILIKSVRIFELSESDIDVSIVSIICPVPACRPKIQIDYH